MKLKILDIVYTISLVILIIIGNVDWITANIMIVLLAFYLCEEDTWNRKEKSERSKIHIIICKFLIIGSCIYNSYLSFFVNNFFAN